MTKLERKVTRATNVTAERNGRPIIISLEPGAEPIVTLREKARRSGYSIPVRRLYTLLAMKAGEQRIAERKAKRAARRLR